MTRFYQISVEEIQDKVTFTTKTSNMSLKQLKDFVKKLQATTPLDKIRNSIGE